MKKRGVWLLVLTAAGFGVAWIVRAGSLEPPGPPAPTMKTLVEVEPRIAINSVNTPGGGGALYRVQAPGSYYLVGNIAATGTHGIRIDSDNVTLDLMGFTIARDNTPGLTNGVHCTGAYRNLTIRNGFVRDFTDYGIELGDCEALISDVRVEGSGSHGIRMGAHSIVRNCWLSNNVGDGVHAEGGFNVIEDSYAHHNQGDGFFFRGVSVVRHNTSVSNGSGKANFHAGPGGNRNRIDENYTAGSASTWGYLIEGCSNLVTRNTSASNGTGYDDVNNCNDWDPPKLNPIGASAWDNFEF